MAMSRARKNWLIIGGVVLGVVLLSLVGLAIFVASLGRKTAIASNSVLVLKVTGDLPDYASEDPTMRIFGVEPKASFATMLMNLRKAKIDSRVGGVLLDINLPQIGWAKADELRDAIAEFRTSGKPVYAYMEFGSNKEYYIATAADKIFMPPTGDIYITGFAAQGQFYKGTFDKIGVEWEDVHVGKYKSANEPFTRKDHSPESREVINAILDDYFGRVVNAIAETRHKSPDEVKTIIDNAPYNALQAQQQNLIDAAKYRDEVYGEFKHRLGYSDKDDLNIATATDYKDVTPESLGLNNGQKIAVIFAQGVITTGRSSEGGAFGGATTIGSDTIIRAVRDAADDDSIKAIVLRVDSPGGSALASDLMWHTLEYAKTKKPVVTSMSDVAASGGYYIACNSNKIVAEPSTVTGSIGVVLGRPAIGGLYEKLGVSEEYITKGKNAGLFRVDKKWTDEERAVFQRNANFFYFDNFVPKVAKGRGRTDEEINQVAQGRVWTGFQAKDKGLVDEFGGLNKAIDVAKDLAKLPADKDVRRVVFPAPRPFLAAFFGNDDEATVKTNQPNAQVEEMVNAMPADLQRALRYRAIFQMTARGETLALTPYDFVVK